VLLAHRPAPDRTFVFLLDSEGIPLATRNLSFPVPAAVVPADTTRGISVMLEAVPGTSVGFAGSLDADLEDAAGYLIRHYRAVFDDAAPAWEWNTPWENDCQWPFSTPRRRPRDRPAGGHEDLPNGGQDFSPPLVLVRVR
jgi:hypothetical protein